MARGNDEPFTLYGLLAKSVETDDVRSYVTFHLDPRARFSDGQPVTAEDVLFSWALLRDHGRPNHRQYYSKVAKAEALDPLTVRFDFGGAGDRELPLILGLMPILPKHAIDVATFEETSMTPPIGSGPYRITEVKPGASVTFTRNPDYWGRDLPVNRGLWNFDEIRLDFYREANGQFEAFKRGLYDFRVETEPLRWHDGYDFPAARDGEVIRDTIKTGVPQPSEFLVFNTRRPHVLRYPGAPGADAAVRFRMDQPQLLLRTFTGARPASSPAPNCRPMAVRPMIASAAAQAVRSAYPTRHSRRQLSPSRHRRFGPRSRDAAQRADAAVPGRLRARRHGVAATLDQNAPHLRNSGDDARSGTDRAGLYARSQARGHRGDGALGGRGSIRSAPLGFDFDMIQNRWDQSLSPGNEQWFYWGSEAADSPGHAQLHGGQRPRDRRHDRGAAGGPRASRFRLGGAGARPGPDVGLLRYSRV